MLDNNASFKYETTYKSPFYIKKCCINDMVILQCGAIKIRYNICHIKWYAFDINVEDIKCWKIYMMIVAYDLPFIYLINR